MRVAVDNLALPEHADTLLWDYLVMAAHSMVNAHDDPAPRPEGPLG
jgi:truncated hemoglobin YjbI